MNQVLRTIEFTVRSAAGKQYRVRGRRWFGVFQRPGHYSEDPMQWEDEPQTAEGYRVRPTPTPGTWEMDGPNGPELVTSDDPMAL